MRDLWILRAAPAWAGTLCVLAALLTATTGGRAQASAEEHQRAGRVRQRFSGLLRGGEVRPRWLDGGRLWFETAADGDSGGHAVVVVDASRAAGTDQPPRQVLCTAGQLGAALQADGPVRVAGLDWDGGDGVKALARGELGVIEWSRNAGTAKRLEPGAVPAFLLRPERGRLRSGRRNGPATALLIVNQTDQDLALQWIDSGGEVRDYGKVTKHSQLWRTTFGGHAWRLLAPDGKVLGGWTAASQPGIALLTADGPIGPPVVGEARDQRPGRSGQPPRRYRDQTQQGSAETRWQAQFRGPNLWLRPQRGGGEAIQVTTDGTDADAYRGPTFWSPDGSRLLCQRIEAPQRHPVHVVESSPRDQLQPKLIEFNYIKPGDKIARPRPQLFRVDQDSGAATPIDIDEDLFANPWSLGSWTASPDGSEVRFVHNHRGHRVLQVQAVDLQSGTVRNVVDERPATFVDYAGKQYLRWIGADDSLIWMSERSGFNHLYRIDAKTGTVLHAITQGDWPVFEVVDFDAEQGELLFTAGGMHPDQDPYHVHYGRVSIDGGDITWLTTADGTHQIDFSPDGSHYLDRYSRVDLPPVAELRRSADGSLVCELDRADDSALRAAGWRAPEPFSAKGRDGKTDIWGWVIRPTHFDPTQRYPVVENIYAGPHGAHVPKSFAVHRREMELAELGFFVVRIDGMGTSRRSKDFHDVAWKNLGDAGFPDRVAWMQALAATDPAMDLSRVGIYGGSAGGQNAMRALIAHGDFYDAAVADCGCHDNRMDKIWWNELWMSWPLGDHYIEASNVEQAHRMQGHLLLTVGELDRNVDPASTMQVVDALIRADKDFELIVFPGGGHGAGSSRYGVRRRRDFFVRHLRDVSEGGR